MWLVSEARAGSESGRRTQNMVMIDVMWFDAVDSENISQ